MCFKVKICLTVNKFEISNKLSKIIMRKKESFNEFF